MFSHHSWEANDKRKTNVGRYEFSVKLWFCRCTESTLTGQGIKLVVSKYFQTAYCSCSSSHHPIHPTNNQHLKRETERENHTILSGLVWFKCDQAEIDCHWVLSRFKFDWLCQFLKDRIKITSLGLYNPLKWTELLMLLHSNSRKTWPAWHDWRTTHSETLERSGDGGGGGYWRQQWKTNWWKATE